MSNPDAAFRVADGARMIHMPGTPDLPETVSHLRPLPESECFELLAVANVGRVGFQSPSGVQIIPQNYRLGAAHQLFMKTAPGSAVAQLAEIDAPAAFEVDLTSSHRGDRARSPLVSTARLPARVVRRASTSLAA